MDESLINTDRKKQKSQKTFTLFAVNTVLIGCLIIAVLVMVAHNKGKIHDVQTTSDRIDITVDSVLAFTKNSPNKFVLPHTSYTPVVSQGHRGTCWNFAQVGVLEGTYRKQGFEKGFLKENEYVKFSEQGFAKHYVDYCKAHPSEGWCLFGGMLKNTTDDGEIGLMYYMWDDINDGLYPETVCRYRPDPDNWDICEHEKAAAPKNPLKGNFHIKDIHSSYDVDRAKYLISQLNVPCGFSSVLYSTVFTIPCYEPSASDFIKNSNECKKCIWKDISGECLYRMVVREYDWGGYFINDFLPGQGFLRVLGGHAQTLVGYNDDFVVDLRGFGDPRDFSKGIFVLKNSWGSSKGHSVDYLMGKISMLEERNRCPMHGDPKYWVPIDPDCIKTEKDPSKCNQSTKQLLRNKFVYGATELECQAPSGNFFTNQIGLDCSADKTYFLSSYSSNEFNTSAGGTVDGASSSFQNLKGQIWVNRPDQTRDYLVFRLIEWDPATKTAKDIYTKDSNWWIMGMLFKPKNFVDNDETLCGYYAMPYSTMAKDAVHQPQADKDTSSITCFDIEWEDAAYLANRKDHADLDYSYLEKSTKEDYTKGFAGPFSVQYAPRNKHAVEHVEL